MKSAGWLRKMPERFLTHTLRQHPQGTRIAQMLAAAIEAVEPAQAVANAMRCQGARLAVGGQEFDPDDFEQIYLIGAGKASAPMARAAAQILGDRLTRGIIITKDGHRETGKLPGIDIFEASHPLPDMRGIAGTRKIIELLQTAGEQTLVICVLSGGGSALLTAPTPGVSLEALRGLTDQLLTSGASIHEINTIRKHLSQIKGGQLAKLAYPAALVTLILSDVVGDNLEIIASGPSVADPSTLAGAAAILAQYGLAAPGALVETPKPGEPIFERVQNVLVGTNRLAAEAAVKNWGTGSKVLRTDLVGEARHAGEWLGAQFDAIPRGACCLVGGETTVTFSGRGEGLGGRNQEVALAAVRQLAGMADAMLITLATDGGDGPTDAAGAVVTGDTLARAKKLGLNPDDFLGRHDAYHFFDALDDLLKPGPTRTNVNDLNFLIR
jgi:glycerate 2-kinase